MAIEPGELRAVLEDRRSHASRVLDEYSGVRKGYSDWDDRVRIMDGVASNDWLMVWPDERRHHALPKIPNLPVLAASHRAFLVSETPPTVLVRPNSIAEKAKELAEKQERVINGWWTRNRLLANLTAWSLDAEFTGLTVCKTMPDFSKQGSERFPVMRRVDPRTAFPMPIFSPGPFLDDCIMAYEEPIESIRQRYGVDVSTMLKKSNRQVSMSNARVIEFYTKDRILCIAEPLYQHANLGTKKNFEILLDTEHKIGRCPITIGVRAGTHDGSYRGTFDHMVGLLNTHNRLMNLHLDAAIDKVYPRTGYYGVDRNDMQQWGPDSTVEYQEPNARLEFITPGNSAYDNQPLMRTLIDFERTGALLPDSVTGNPDESVISAAGIAATQSMPNALVVSLQRDTIAPMLQAANEIAAAGECAHANVEKAISGVITGGDKRGGAYVENYTPDTLFAGGDYSNEVVYGVGSGLDKVNTGVMVKQDLGAGLLSKREARELNPNIADPQRTEGLIVKETMQDAALAAILVNTQTPPGTPGHIDQAQLDAIWEDIDAGKSVREALRNHVESMPVPLPPSPTPQGGALASPGIAGAGEPQPPTFNGPPLDQVLA